MSKSQTLIVAALLCASATGAFAYVYPGNPNCPWANPHNTWVKYLSQEYGDKEPLFSIHFIRHIGDLEGGQCYLVGYLGNENWMGSGKIRTVRNQAKVEPQPGQPPRHGGDPKKYEINVWGARFTYNEAGEVYYVTDGKLAGNMYCHVGSECWK